MAKTRSRNQPVTSVVTVRPENSPYHVDSLRLDDRCDEFEPSIRSERDDSYKPPSRSPTSDTTCSPSSSDAMDDVQNPEAASENDIGGSVAKQLPLHDPGQGPSEPSNGSKTSPNHRRRSSAEIQTPISPLNKLHAAQTHGVVRKRARDEAEEGETSPPRHFSQPSKASYPSFASDQMDTTPLSASAEVVGQDAGNAAKTDKKSPPSPSSFVRSMPMLTSEDKKTFEKQADRIIAVSSSPLPIEEVTKISDDFEKEQQVVQKRREEDEARLSDEKDTRDKLKTENARLREIYRAMTAGTQACLDAGERYRIREERKSVMIETKQERETKKKLQNNIAVKIDWATRVKNYMAPMLSPQQDL